MSALEVLLYPSKCILCHPSISCDGTCLKKDTSARLIGSSANSTSSTTKKNKMTSTKDKIKHKYNREKQRQTQMTNSKDNHKRQTQQTKTRVVYWPMIDTDRFIQNMFYPRKHRNHDNFDAATFQNSFIRYHTHTHTYTHKRQKQKTPKKIQTCFVTLVPPLKEIEMEKFS